jgi:hypothetical protein
MKPGLFFLIPVPINRIIDKQMLEISSFEFMQDAISDTALWMGPPG